MVVVVVVFVVEDCGDQEGRAAAISRHFPASAPRLPLFSSSSHTHRTLGPVTIQADHGGVVGELSIVIHCGSVQVGEHAF